jgi:hypothetical protein
MLPVASFAHDLIYYVEAVKVFSIMKHSNEHNNYNPTHRIFSRLLLLILALTIASINTLVVLYRKQSRQTL